MFNDNQDSLRDAIIFGVCLWGFSQTQPLFLYGKIQWLPALCAGIGFLLGMKLLHTALLNLSRLLDWLSSHTASGLAGTAQWGTYKNLKPELIKSNLGPYWGVAADKPNKPLIIDYASNVVTIGTSGSKKTISVVVPTALSNPHSKVIPDFKGGDIVSVLKPALEKRGEIVRIINPFEQITDIVGETDRFNPLDVIVECLLTKGALRNITGLTRSLVFQLYQEPDTGESDDTYWREGGRILVFMAIIIEVIIDGYDADLAAVTLKIKNRKNFERDLRWILGIDAKGDPDPEGALPIEKIEWAKNHSEEDVSEFAAYLRSEAQSILELMIVDDSKTFDSFVSGARQKLTSYTFGWLSPVLRNSTFKMTDLKEKKVTLIPMGDPSQLEETEQFLSLIQWCAINMMKRHPDKHVPVYFIMDESTNYTIFDLVNLLTYGRDIGVRLHLIFQAIKAFVKRYGEEALDVLLSEAEIKQILPSQRAPETLTLISEMLGDQSIMSAAISLKQDAQGLSENMSESARPLATPDEVRRSPHGILIVREHLPQKINMVSYAEIDPYKHIVGINPRYGKRFSLKTKLRIRH